MEYVFGYGSLVDEKRLAAFFNAAGMPAPPSRMAELKNYRRVWNVAMDNRDDIPGYKVYHDDSGRRHDGYVAFLNAEPCAGGSIEGRLFAVTAEQLALLDARERNYARIDIAPLLGIEGRLWIYRGSDAARARFDAGMADAAHPVVISRGYLQQVEQAFAALGEGSLAAYRASTQRPAGLRDIPLSPRAVLPPAPP